jgi:hypothetical protein
MVNIIRLHAKNWLCNLPGSAIKVPGGGWVMVVGGWLEKNLSDQLWLSFSLALAKPNNFYIPALKLSITHLGSKLNAYTFLLFLN